MEIIGPRSLDRGASLLFVRLRGRRCQRMVHGCHCRARRTKVSCLETRRPHVSCVDEQLRMLRMVRVLVLVMRVVTGSVLRHLWRTGMAKAMMRILSSFVEHARWCWELPNRLSMVLRLLVMLLRVLLLLLLMRLCLCLMLLLLCMRLGMRRLVMLSRRSISLLRLALRS